VKYFEDLSVGDVVRGSETYVLTEAEILEFGRKWDPQPFHTDPVAAEASIFGGLVASSVHLFAVLVKLGMASEPTAAVSSLGFKHLRNHAPARPGDELGYTSTVVSVRPSQSHPGLGVVEFECELTNEADEVVFSFENACLVPFRDGPAVPA
jgi:acyl dehydratase